MPSDPGTCRCLVRLQGDVDLASGPKIRQAITEAIAKGDGDVVIDMSGVTFIGATGLNILVSVRNRLINAGRQLIVGSPSRTVRRTLALCRMDQVLQIEDD